MLSLQKSVASCSVSTGYADKLWSDRQLNPNSLLCPVWSGLDTYGRVASFDSFNTKTAGCASAEDRVAVENFLRPSYAEYTALDASGYLNPAALGEPVSVKESFQKGTSLHVEQELQRMAHQNGAVGINYRKTNQPYSSGLQGVNGNVSTGFQGFNQPVHETYVDTRANRNFQERRDLSAISGWKSHCAGCNSGSR
jgi:hypothetical protein